MVCTDLLNGIRQERFVVYSLMVGITILTALSFFLVPRYGTVGAAAAQLGAGAIMVPMNLRVLARRVGLENLHGVSLIRLALALAAAAAVGYLLLRVNYYLSLAGFLATALAASYGFGALPEQFARFADRAVATAFRRTGAGGGGWGCTSEPSGAAGLDLERPSSVLGSMTLPNFIVIGPGKTGTTWLYRGALAAHPDVCLAHHTKETVFFADFYDRGLGWYEKFFEGCTGATGPAR